MFHFTLTVDEAYRDVCRKFAGKPAIHVDGQTLTYGELSRRANRVAHALVKLGVIREIRVALLMPNRLEYVVCQQGIYQAGGTMIPMNDMLRGEDILYILNDSGAEVLVVDETFFGVIEESRGSLDRLRAIIGLPTEGTMPEGFISWKEFQESEPETDLVIQRAPDDIVQSVYTGGTTGHPKGVLHNHQTMMSTLLSTMLELEITPEEKMLIQSPLPHAAGLSMMAGLLRGAEVYIERKFDMEKMLRKIEDEHITYIMAVPTMLYRVMDYLKDRSFDISSLKTIVYGTAPISSKRLHEAIDTFGPIFIQTYGLTETPGIAVKLAKGEHLKALADPSILGSCGRPTMYSRVKVTDESGRELEPGEEGEILIHSPATMVGYHKLPEKTAETIVDGWLHTGDMGMIDNQGYLHILDRKKDMIISGGMNVYSSEVENVIARHPAVSMAAVIGVPHADWGEAVTAFVVPKDAAVDVRDVAAWCKEHLSKYKNPKEIHIVNALPLTNYGKVDKKALRRPFWETAERRI